MSSTNSSGTSNNWSRCAKLRTYHPGRGQKVAFTDITSWPDHHSTATGPINRRTRRVIKRADVASSSFSMFRLSRAGVNDRSDMLAAQRGGEAARHESVHDLHAVDMARGRHDFQQRRSNGSVPLSFASSAAVVSRSSCAFFPSGPLGSVVYTTTGR